MAFETLINTITLVCLVLLGLWIVAHIVQAVGLLCMRRAYRLHSKNVFTISFVPLQTRLFHELAVPQFLASEAIQRGDVPPAPRVLQRSGDVAEYGNPGVAPSVTPPMSSSTPSSLINSVLTGSPLSTLSSTEDSKVLKLRKKGTKAAESREVVQSQAEVNKPVAVAVPLPPAALESADAASPSWWTPKLEGQDLVLGLQLPWQLQSSAPHSLSARLEKELNGAASLTSTSKRTGRSPSPAANQRGIDGGRSSRNSSRPGAGSSTPLGSSRRQPTVSLQLKQYRLTSDALLSMTAPLSGSVCAPSSNLRDAARLDLQRNGRDFHHHYYRQHRREDDTAANGSPELRAAIDAQLATAPMQIRVQTMTAASVPRPVRSSYAVNAGGGSAMEERAGPLDFDAIRYAYIRYHQRLLEVAVAEQTAMAHRGKYDRKSAKRAQRIAAVLMQYLQYIHDDDGDEDATVMEDSFEVEGSGHEDGSNSPGSSNSTSRLDGGRSSTVNRGRGVLTGTGVFSMRRRGNQSPWVPLLEDGRDDLGGVRHLESSPAAASPPRKQPSQSFSQPAASRRPSLAAAQVSAKNSKGGIVSADARSPPQPSPSLSPAIVVAPPPPPPTAQESRRSTRKRREAAQEIADSAVDALEALVERVRQAQTLRPRYQALLLTVNFRAERFIVRRGASGLPTWTALSVPHASMKAGAGASSSPFHGVDGGGEVAGSRQLSSFSFNNHSKTSFGQPRSRSLNTRESGSGVYDLARSDSATSVSNSGEFAPESSRTSAVDGRTERREGSRGKTSPFSSDQSTHVPIQANSNADETDATAALEYDVGTTQDTSRSSKRSVTDPSSPVKTSQDLQTLSRSSSPTPSADAAKVPPLSAGSFASITPLGSTSANDAATEFLRASRRLKPDPGSQQLGVEYSHSHSANGPTKRNSSFREGIKEDSVEIQGLPIENDRQRRAAEPVSLPHCDSKGQPERSTLLRQDTCSGYSDGGMLHAPSLPPADASLNNNKPQHQQSPSMSMDATGTASSALPGPRETDLRVAYIIGADRATLLRSLTLDATQTFAAGTQNFLCFFTHEDEQRARRRHLEQMDRQCRLELQRRLSERTHALADGQDGGPSPSEERHGSSDAHANASRSSFVQAPPAVVSVLPSRSASGLGSGSLRYTRAAGWHTVGLGGSGAAYSDSAAFGEENDSVSRRDRYAPSLSQHSLHSLASDSATFTTPPPRPASTSGAGEAAVVVHANPQQSKKLDGSVLNASDTIAPHSLEVSLHSPDDGAGVSGQQRGDATEKAVAHVFQTAASLTSSALSANASTLSTPLQAGGTVVGVGVSLPENGGDAVTAGVQSAPNNRSCHEETGKHPATTEAEELLSLISTDDAFAHSLHSVGSVAEQLTDLNAVSTPLHSPLRVEISAAPASAESATASKAPVAEADKSDNAVLPPPPSQENAGAAKQAKELNGSANSRVANKAEGWNKKDVKKPNALPSENAKVKGKGKKAEKAAVTSAVAAAGSATPKEIPIPASATSTLLTLPILDLPDTIGDHDVRGYYAAIGITLPEQVFLLRDAPTDLELYSSTSAGVPHGGGGGGRRQRSATPTRRASKSLARTRSASSFAPLQSAAVPQATVKGTSLPQRCGVARVLEGQVEVAELSLDVLNRQLGPFIPQKEPVVDTRSNSSVDDGSGSDDDDDDNSRDEASSSSYSSSSSEALDNDKYRHRRSKKRQQRQEKKMTRAEVAFTREERDARQSPRNTRRDGKGRTDDRSTQRPRAARRTQSRRDAKNSAATSPNRAKRRRRRQRKQQRRIAVWRRRLLRKQAASNRAGYSPVSVAALFFTAPPPLPRALLQRFEAQRTVYEHAALPLPSWALGSLVSDENLSTTTAPRHMADHSAGEPQQPQQQQRASICVTLIYTSTAEQVTQTLLVAREIAASAAFTRKAALSSSLENSLIFNGNHSSSSNRVGPRRGSWVDGLRDWQQNENRLGSSANRFGGNYDENRSLPKGASSMNTSPPSPIDSIHTRGRTRGPDSFASSLTALPPPPAVSGSATAEKRSQREKSGRGDEQMSENRPEGSRVEDRAAVAISTATDVESQPLPPLLLLAESADSFMRYADDAAPPPHARSKTAEGVAHQATSVFMDAGNGSSNFDARRFGREETMCFEDDMVAAGNASNSSRAYRTSALGGAKPGDDAVYSTEFDNSLKGARRLTTAADGVVDVLRDSASFPDGVPISLSLAYVRIGDDLYAVTEVIDRTFLQYREERVIHPSAKHTAVEGDVASYSDSGEDVESRNGASSLFNTSFSSDTPFSTLDAALEAIQNQHEATARQQRRRMHHRRRAVSTMNFGDLSYSLAGPAPVRPGTRRQEVHMCWRCLSAEAAVIFLPCGHYAVCEDCAEVLADCCVCKTPILSSVVLLERKKAQRTASTPKQHQPPPQQSEQR
ncbi:hypothetical protein ABB37_00110 [Leptomonas pyrrhocoris]|uniref:Uncharacterized protein n=1 Tax=Leptomonas pyrrhocoris TaxID=157538 RepID=A0A0M9G9Z0_LEPPY|nr:hypothetical protein ABB37_00110 [Leptomonas pyrrhocoris]KPA85749.1 hypothetical protein ABB37_00110 [Leptomonas pyrrhocoris]|eukprot:XP_015664188.1 hypothetical protein ABB37_00110 [Leptomonas pyrrhocoris]